MTIIHKLVSTESSRAICGIKSETGYEVATPIAFQMAFVWNEEIGGSKDVEFCAQCSREERGDS